MENGENGAVQLRGMWHMPCAYDVHSGRAEKQTRVLISCVIATVTRGEGVQFFENFKDVICTRPLSPFPETLFRAPLSRAEIEMEWNLISSRVRAGERVFRRKNTLLHLSFVNKPASFLIDNVTRLESLALRFFEFTKVFKTCYLSSNLTKQCLGLKITSSFPATATNSLNVLSHDRDRRLSLDRSRQWNHLAESYSCRDKRAPDEDR